METFVSGLLTAFLTAFATLIALLVSVFFLEIVAAILAPRRAPTLGQPADPRPLRVAVMVPAHDESAGLLPTLADVNNQLRPGDRLLVVADNCSDDTTAVAAAAGAEVTVRDDPTRIGKGYALDWGLSHLRSDPPDVVIIIDADCRLGEGAIEQLTRACASTGRPAQALYLMTAPTPSLINHQVAELAWLVKNWVRPLGLHTLGLPSQLVGAGMAFPWKVTDSINVASGWIVEDLKLGLDLAAAGHPPVFCPSALVTSEFAGSAGGAAVQRARWERGHLATIGQVTPHLVYLAAKRHDAQLFALAVDVMVPPLSMLVLLLVVTLAMTGMAARWGFSAAPLILSGAALVGFTIAIALAWIKFGRDVLPPRAVLSIPRYVLGKLGVYRDAMLGRRAGQWIRTDRTRP